MARSRARGNRLTPKAVGQDFNDIVKGDAA